MVHPFSSLSQAAAIIIPVWLLTYHHITTASRLIKPVLNVSCLAPKTSTTPIFTCTNLNFSSLKTRLGWGQPLTLLVTYAPQVRCLQEPPEPSTWSVQFTASKKGTSAAIFSSMIYYKVYAKKLYVELFLGIHWCDCDISALVTKIPARAGFGSLQANRRVQEW